MISNQLLWIVLTTHNLEPSISTLPLFKSFKFLSLQVWTRFVKFGEIHISSAPKIPPKFRQPPDAMRVHHTKDQLKKNSPHAKIISSNTWPALFLCTFRKFRVAVSFSSECWHWSPVHPGALRTASSPWLEHRTPAWMDAGVGGGEHLQRRQPLWWQGHPWRPNGACSGPLHRSAPPFAP